VTEFDASTLLTSLVMDCQIQVIGKVVRPFFTDPVTFTTVYNSCVVYTTHSYVTPACPACYFPDYWITSVKSLIPI